MTLPKVAGERVIPGTRGWVFFCNNTTQEENFRRNLVGTLAKYLPRFNDLRPGDPILLYNYEAALLVGHFTATSEPRIAEGPDAWSQRYPAQVSVRLEARFPQPVSRTQLEGIQDLVFDGRGYLMNFSLPLEAVQEILDVATGRKGKGGEIANPVEKGFRQKFPAKFLTSDGHWVRSKAELLIDNWLYTRRPPIAHAYERRLPVPEEAYADFYIPIGDFYIEYWGLETPEYSERQKRKRALFRRYGLKVIELEERDVTELDDRLPEKLLEHLPGGYRIQ